MISSLLDDSTKCTKKFWAFVKSKKKDQFGVAALEHQGKVYTDSLSKANLLNNQFASVFTREDLSHIPEMSGNQVPDIPDVDIQIESVIKLLQELDSHKANGPDSIPANLLKQTAIQTAPLLALIFKASVEQGKLPDDWKLAYITPIFKKENRGLAANYQPISLTSICCKVLEHILHSSIFTHLERHEVLCEQQHGFRSGRSCETQLLGTVHDFATCLNNGGHIDALFLDMAKAFDKVPHQRLCAKLSHYGINDNILTWIKDFLNNRHQTVVLEGEHSTPCNVLSGVPQGTVMAPLLFLIYINDIPNSITNMLRLYADNALLYSIINSNADCINLQTDLSTLQKWCKTWQMEFNPTKCEHFQITNRHNFTDTHYTLFGHTIQKVTNAKYLAKESPLTATSTGKAIIIQ